MSGETNGAVSRSVEIAAVRITDRRRKGVGIEELADAIKDLGFLLNPITVTDNMTLVAGFRRLKACQLLGWTKIPARVIPATKLNSLLAEIDENLHRQELTALEQGEHLAERKAVYLAMHPETKKGGAPGKAGGGKKAKTENVSDFATDAARKTGQTDRNVRNKVAVGQKLTQATRDAVRETSVADKQSELLKLTKLPAADQESAANLIREGTAKGVKEAVNKLKAAEIKAEPSPLPTGPFRVIVVDPPWAYDNRPDDASHRAANPYPSLSVDGIRALPVGTLACEDCVLWLWTTNAHMREAFGVLDAWGFIHKTILTWVKHGIGTGDWLRGKTEHCLMAVRGKPTVTLTNQTTAITGPLREHSRKPEEFYSLVESLCPGSKLELFARTARDGWQVHGNQTGLFQGNA